MDNKVSRILADPSGAQAPHPGIGIVSMEDVSQEEALFRVDAVREAMFPTAHGHQRLAQRRARMSLNATCVVSVAQL